jgi:acyl carrier protein phosphodiesterase
MQQSLEIMSRYTSLPEKSALAVEIMNHNFDFIRHHFTFFMNDIIAFVEGEAGILVQTPKKLKTNRE